jgi:hypothetical protein
MGKKDNAPSLLGSSSEHHRPPPRGGGDAHQLPAKPSPPGAGAELRSATDRARRHADSLVAEMRKLDALLLSGSSQHRPRRAAEAEMAFV